MSRRESRSSLGARQNDALFEFESFKKKFLLANKHITKLNSTLSVRIEELNAQISMLYVENLRLRASEISLAAQLKRERDNSQKILADAEAATQNLVKHLLYLRETHNIKIMPNTPPTPPSPRARRPVLNINTSPTSPLFNRISRPPNVPGICEEEEPIESSEELEKEATPPRKRSKTKPRISASKLPLPTRSSSPTPTSLPGLVNHHMDIDAMSTSSKPRKTIRRQSGLLSVNTDSLSVPRSGSPAFGSPIRLEAARAEEAEELAAVHGEFEMMIIDQDAEVELAVKKEKRKGKTKEQRGSESEKDVVIDGGPRPREKKRQRDEVDASDSPKPKVKDTITLRTALQPIDSNVNEQIDTEPKISLNRQFLQPGSPVGSAPTSHGSSSPTPAGSSEAEGAHNGTGSRERRTRKSVNYAEPKLNTKMRKPDPEPGAADPSRKKRSSAAAVMTGIFSRTPSSSLYNGMEGGNDADVDTEARSSLEMPPPVPPLPGNGLSMKIVDGNYINPALFPLPSSRPGSAAAMYSPGPPTRISGSTTSVASITPSSSSSSTFTVASTTVKKKKSRPQVILSDEESDGAEADAEYMGSGGGSKGTAAWVNVEGRRKALPKRSAATAAVAALEDIRRHSMAT